MLIENNTFQPMFKYWSPMSLGSWALLIFGIFSLIGFMAALAEAEKAIDDSADLRPPSKNTAVAFTIGLVAAGALAWVVMTLLGRALGWKGSLVDLAKLKAAVARLAPGAITKESLLRNPEAVQELAELAHVAVPFSVALAGELRHRAGVRETRSISLYGRTSESVEAVLLQLDAVALASVKESREKRAKPGACGMSGEAADAVPIENAAMKRARVAAQARDPAGITSWAPE